MSDFALRLSAGAVAYVVAFLTAAGPLLYASHLSSRLPAFLHGYDEERQVSKGNRSIAIRLGARMLCQAILIRHAVYATAAVVRSLFVYQYPLVDSLWLIGRSIFLIFVINILAMISILAAEETFKFFTKKINEEAEIERDNVAVAVFVAFALLSITLVLDPGMEDFANAFIPLGRSGLS
jgi:uncharacterized membrane protein YjfL (UPF0719 family)